MATAKVQGLLQYNTDIRNEHLRKNFGKYSQYTDELIHPIGESASIDYNKPLYSSTDNKGLFDFTQDNKTDYSRFINKRYFGNRQDKDVYNVRNLNPEEIEPWNMEFTDYTQYIDEILGKDAATGVINYVNNLLAGQYIENALRQTEVGVVRDYSVSAAMAGAVTTNISNFSGKDTRLGLITNQLYSHGLYYGAQFNTDRMNSTIHIGDDVYVPKTYLTPSLYNQYGNNLSNVFRLSEILRVNDGEQRIRGDLSADVTFNDYNVNTNPSLNFLRYQYKQTEEYLNQKKKTNRTYNYSDYVYTSVEGDDSRKIIDANFDYNDYIKSPNGKLTDTAVYGMYNEYDEPKEYTNDIESQDGSEFEIYKRIEAYDDNSLIAKTNELFRSHKISTMIGRFHTSEDNGLEGNGDDLNYIDSAKSIYGNSHGRNLLKLDAKTQNNDTNGYDNPYCRTWTYHHQYNQVRKLIRPFMDDDKPIDMSTIQEMNRKFRASRGKVVNGVFESSMDGVTKLAQNTVLQDNNFVRITPKVDDQGNIVEGIQKCMFSLENLAWKDFNGKKNLSREQLGPNGGRIMWFPPYNLKFQESVDVNWDGKTFIGRGEDVYTYKNTSRTGTLSFALLIDHPAILNKFVKTDGMGDEKDPHADILRFFAGCSLLSGDVEDEPKEKPNTPPEETMPESQTLSFKVYFPNNFSGVISNQKGLYEADDNFSNYTQSTGTTQSELWWRYLLVGNHTIIPDDSHYEWFVGYEMNGVSGTTITNNGQNDEDFIKNNFIEACSNQTGSNTPKGVKNINCNKGIGKYYQYHCDDDLRQKLKSDNSYIDETNSGLNAIIKGKRKDNVYTFAEVILALMEFSGMNNENYEMYCYNNCGVSIENVTKLLNIFKSNPEYTEITIKGSADNNDNKNSIMLANRRAYVIQRLLKETLLKSVSNPDEVFNKQESTTGGEGNASPSIKNNKESRFAEVTITYNPGTNDKLSNTNLLGSADNSDGKYITFDKFKEILIDNSDIIKIYSETQGLDLDAELKTEGIWKEETYLENDWVNNKTAHQKEINEVIKNVIKKVGKEWIQLAYSISVEPTYNEFIEKARILTNNSSDMDDDNPKVKKLKKEYDDLVSKRQKKEEDKKNYEKQKSDLEKEQKEAMEQLSKVSKNNTSKTNKILKTIKNDENKINKLNKKIEKLDKEIKNSSNKEEEKYGQYITALIETTKKDGTNDTTIENLEKELSETRQKIKDKNIEIDDLYKRLSLYLNDDKLEEYKNDYDIALNEYTELISNSEASKSEIKGKENKVKNTFEKYDTYRNNIGTQMLSISDEIEKKNKEREQLFQEVKKIEGEISKIEKTNDILTEDALIFMCHLQQEISSNTTNNITGSFTSCLFDDNEEITTEFEPRDCIYDDSGIERNISADSPTNGLSLSFNTMFKHYLLIDYISDNYKNDYGDNFYLIFEKMGSNYTAYENRYYSIFENSIECGSGCTDEQKKNATQELINLEHDLKELLSEVDKEIQDKNERKKQEEKNNNTQKVIENNVDNEEEKIVEQENQLVRWARYDVNMDDNRYENEAEYFKKIETKNPFFFKSLKEKFKYFDPAFHSLSPEGFNARLTFLHQCTRQGGTIEASSSNKSTDGTLLRPTRTAANLAFGRMPVCVLRIGDFIHTKILIKSMTIDYENNGGMNWDLNPEGAGVQPMFANVSLSIVLLGGQSLETPINRLQNALTFNYYANAEVYDNRADSAIYKGDYSGDIEYKNFFDYGADSSTNTDNSKGNTPADNVSDIPMKESKEKTDNTQAKSGEKLDNDSGQNLVLNRNSTLEEYIRNTEEYKKFQSDYSNRMTSTIIVNSTNNLSDIVIDLNIVFGLGINDGTINNFSTVSEDEIRQDGINVINEIMGELQYKLQRQNMSWHINCF